MTTPQFSPDELKAWIEQLQTDDTQQRRDAAIALWNVRDEALIHIFIKATHDDDATVRANVVGGLGTNQANDALGRLIELVQHDESEIVRERAVTSLAQIGNEEVIDVLIDAMDDKSPFVRNRAIYVLGASRDVRVVEPIIEALDHETPSTVGVAAWALGALGDLQAYEPLLGLLNDKKAEVRGNVAWALGELGEAQAIPRLLPLLKDKKPEVRGKTAWALGALGEESGNVSMVKPLIDLLDDFTKVKGQATHVFVSQYAAEALMQIGNDVAKLAVQKWRPRAEEELLPHRMNDFIGQLRSDDKDYRTRVAQELGRMGDVALPFLEKALTHRNVRIRQGIAMTFGEFPKTMPIDTLIRALQDEDIGVWSQTVASLSKSDEALHAPLMQAMESDHEYVQFGCALALWRCRKEETAFTRVLQAVQHDEMLVRSSAITALWLKADERALATLQIRLNEEVPALQPYVLQAIHAIGTEGAHATLRHYMNQQAEVQNDEH